MVKYISFEEVCNHKKNFPNTELKLEPGAVYKSGTNGNQSDEVLSKLLMVGNSGGMRPKNNIKKQTAYLVLNITYRNNNWEDFVDYDEMEVIYYGDNASSDDIFDTRHGGNTKVKYLFDHIREPKKQFPLFLFERDEDCVHRDFKYVGLVVPSREEESLCIVREEINKRFIYNFRFRLNITQDIVDFRWIKDMISGIEPLESIYCPIQWKTAILENV